MLSWKTDLAIRLQEQLGPENKELSPCGKSRRNWRYSVGGHCARVRKILTAGSTMSERMSDRRESEAGVERRESEELDVPHG